MQGRGRAIAVGVLLPLVAASALACDGIIGLTDPSVVSPEADSALLPDVEEPSDSNPTSTAEASTAEASIVDASTGASAEGSPPDAAGSAPDGGPTFADSTVPFPDSGSIGVDVTMVSDSPCANCATDGATVAIPTVILINSSPDLPSVRVCFGTEFDGVAPYLPIPDQAGPGQTIPGMDLWTGAAIPSGVKVGFPAGQAVEVTPYVLRADAAALAGLNQECEQLIGSDGQGGELTAGIDFWPVTPIPGSTFAGASVGFILLRGCLPLSLDPDASIERCGTDYDGGVNLQDGLYPFMPLAPSPNLGARVIQGSRPIDGVYAQQSGGDVSEVVSIGGGQPADLTFKAFAIWDNVMQSDLDMQVVPAEGGVLATYDWSLSDIAQITTGSNTTPDGGPFYLLSQTYTFVIVGDPSAPPDSGAQPHAIVFPDGLVPPVYP